MENPDVDLEQIVNECIEMVQEIGIYNLETWANQAQLLRVVCERQDSRGLQTLHEDLKVRLMSAQN